MKKVLALMLALVLVLSLAACGGGNSSSSSENTTENATTEATDKVYAIGDTVKTDVAEVAVTEVKFVDNFNNSASESDHQYVSVTFTFKNIGKSEISWIEMDVPSPTSTKYLYQTPFVDYNNGYCFYVGNVEFSKHNYSDSNFGINKIEVDDLKPLSEAVTETSGIYVPNEVADNKEAPLLVKIIVPKSEGSEIFAYKVR